MSRYPIEIYSTEKFSISIIGKGDYIITKGEESKPISPSKIVSRILGKKFGQLDSGVLEFSIALVALSALFSTSDNYIAVRIIALIILGLSAYAAGVLYWLYLSIKFPHIYLFVLEKSSITAIFRYYFKLIKKVFITPLRSTHASLPDDGEFAFLTLLACYSILVILIITYAAYEIVTYFTSGFS
ncbi:MAG: hypothetical protein JW757_01305 [Anaerolineales bacterium]|nr:hypothetical protein [Anaerolineales bacterium]